MRICSLSLVQRSFVNCALVEVGVHFAGCVRDRHAVQLADAVDERVRLVDLSRPRCCKVGAVTSCGYARRLDRHGRRVARAVAERRAQAKIEMERRSTSAMSLDDLARQIESGDVQEIPVIVKADVQGSVEAVKQSLVKLSNEEVMVKVIHGGVGAVSESDIMLANASNAIIVGFNVRPDPVATEIAERDGVDMRMYRIIYDCIEEIEDAMKGMLAPKFREVLLGRIEVRNVFKLSSAGMVAGSYVQNGKVTRNAQIRVVRDGIVIAEDAISSLKRFKDDVKEVASGYECGIGLNKFSDVKEGDIFEAYITEEYRD